MLVQNERTINGRYDDFDDLTGERYHFIARYAGSVRPGTPFVYYRGIRHAGGRRPVAEYFGSGRIGEVWQDPRPANPGPRFYCLIEDYTPFPRPVPARSGKGWVEPVRSAFGFQQSVRRISAGLYARILSEAGLDAGGDAPTGAGRPEPPPTASVTFQVTESGLWRPGPRESGRESGSGGRGGAGVRRSAEAHRIGQRGETLAMAYLRSSLPPAHACTLRSVALLRLGWDLEYDDELGVVKIEVKATSGPGFVSVELTAGEWAAASRLGTRYHLLLIADVWSPVPRVQLLVDPAAAVQEGRLEIEPLVFRLVPSRPHWEFRIDSTTSPEEGPEGIDTRRY